MNFASGRLGHVQVSLSLSVEEMMPEVTTVADVVRSLIYAIGSVLGFVVACVILFIVVYLASAAYYQAKWREFDRYLEKKKTRKKEEPSI